MICIRSCKRCSCAVLCTVAVSGPYLHAPLACTYTHTHTYIHSCTRVSLALQGDLDLDAAWQKEASLSLCCRLVRINNRVWLPAVCCPACQSIWLSICLPVCPSVCLFVCLSVCLCVSLSVCLHIYCPVYLPQPIKKSIIKSHQLFNGYRVFGSRSAREFHMRTLSPRAFSFVFNFSFRLQLFYGWLLSNFKPM